MNSFIVCYCGRRVARLKGMEKKMANFQVNHQTELEGQCDEQRHELE